MVKMTYGTKAWWECETLPRKEASRQATKLATVLAQRDVGVGEFRIDERTPMCSWANEKYFVRLELQA